MKTKLKCIMLVDDNTDDNFFHEREIKKVNTDNIVITKDSGISALAYLKLERDNNYICPDLIFLDINMPGMNGWEFLQEYNNLDKALQSKVIMIMLTTSENIDDIARSKNWNFVSDYKTKPLTKEMMVGIINTYFI